MVLGECWDPPRAHRLLALRFGPLRLVVTEFLYFFTSDAPADQGGKKDADHSGAVHAAGFISEFRPRWGRGLRGRWEGASEREGKTLQRPKCVQSCRGPLIH